jgi:hypothetical protein
MIERLRFHVGYYQEIFPNTSKPELSLQLEDGTIQLADSPEKNARRIYQGVKSRPTGQLDLLATDAGRAKTLIGAQRACEKLVPLGEWKLATVSHIMAFFGDLLSGYSVPEDPNKKGFLFWASSGREEEDKKNKDTFFTTPQLGGNEIETHSFSEFVSSVRKEVAKSKTANEKNYWLGFLKHIKDGIPVICVIGTEP